MYNTTNQRIKRPVNKSAVWRIVIWSVVLFILCGVFALVMTAQGFFGGGMSWGAISLGGYTYDHANSYSVGNAAFEGSVTEIDIDWVGGDIAIVPTDESVVRIEETYAGDNEDLRLRWKVENGRLSIKYRKSYRLIGASDPSTAKDLTVRVPRAMLDALEEVDLDVVGSAVTFTGRTSELEFDGVNGSLTISGHVGELNLDHVEATLDFTGTLGHGDLDGVELHATMRLDAAKSLDIDGVDHEVTLYLADTITGFRVSRESLGGDTIVEGFDNVTAPVSGTRRWGDGSLVIESDGVDAKLTIKKLTKD